VNAGATSQGRGPVELPGALRDGKMITRFVGFSFCVSMKLSRVCGRFRDWGQRGEVW
jgi:hypothetical protein